MMGKKLFPLGDIASLLQCYASDELSPTQLVEAIHAEIQNDPDHAWISTLPLEALKGYARKVEAADMASLPLYGIPFAIKDNIDLAGLPTTAACPAFAYSPSCSATVVKKLIDAGAIPIGKTNLDQFATGLNGTRSAYGACRNAFDPAYISGGSSSGSAVAVAKGQVCFSLGTDTAGSGRVPAAFNNLIGYKPTKGWLSTHGVVPACRSLDTVSIFAFTVVDVAHILETCVGYDAADIYSRKRKGHGFNFGTALHFRFGIPRKQHLKFFDNHDSERLFDETITRMQALGGEAVEVDFEPFLEAARLLYEGPWVAERYAAIQSFFELHGDQIIAPVHEIIATAKHRSATDVFNGFYQLRRIKQQADQIWTHVDCLLTPTTGTIYSIQAIQRDPIRLNTNLGYYTNFMNLLDYAAIAVPAGFQNNGLPFGITLAAPAHQDHPLLHLAHRLQQAQLLSLGATGIAVRQDAHFPAVPGSGQVRIAVCGAHLSGLPLNGQLTSRRGRLVTSTTTSPDYRLYALPGNPPQRPGLIRVNKNEQGVPIEVEVWELPMLELGSFVAGIPAPLGIGTITLANGETLLGFVCERYAVENTLDISQLGGWRNYLKQRDLS
ncbi:allophanate hydrolase [Nitrosomonas ureae]|uniref:Allophanate hydrolase n=1 Tax=Nitrosomonas ureae TaxID=44577 RepID=A0A2T5IW19_9PROT|nr:allophanate hydrolase [Nitrosomonas ureae]PTQ88044.1 allophanate hydrolase [Nitrosomonas ureae]